MPDTASDIARGIVYRMGRMGLRTACHPTMRFNPVEVDGEIRIDAALPDTPEGREAADLVRTGARAGLSIEFHAVDEGTVSGVREVRSALVDAAALVPSRAYDQARAEVRRRQEWRPWL